MGQCGIPVSLRQRMFEALHSPQVLEDHTISEALNVLFPCIAMDFRRAQVLQ